MLGSFFSSLWIALIVVLLLALGFSALLFRRFVHGRPDALLVVMGAVGKGQRAKILHGGVTFVWPIIQSWDWLSLTPITVTLALKGALSKENIRVNVPCAFIVAVDNENIGTMESAAIRILEIIKDKHSFNSFCEDIIFGQMRAVIASMSISQINGNRQEFQEKITDAVSTELAKVGLKLITVNIQDISDEAQYIENLGKKAAAEAEAEASIAIAEQKRLGETGATLNDAERRKNISENELIAISAENANQAKIAESKAELERRIRETQATNSSEAQITASNAEKKAALVKANNETEIFKAQEKAQTAKEAFAVAAMRVAAKPETEKAILEETAKGQAEGAKLKERMAGEAEGVYALMKAKADGIREVVKAAGGDAQAAILLLMSDKLPEILSEYAKMAANRPIDHLVCIDNNGEKGGAVAGLTRSLIAAMPQIQEVIKAFGLNPSSLESIKEEDFSKKTATNPTNI